MSTMSFLPPMSMARNWRPVLASAETRRKSGSSAWSLAMSSSEILMGEMALMRASRSSLVSCLICLSCSGVDEDDDEEEEEEDEEGEGESGWDCDK